MAKLVLVEDDALLVRLYQKKFSKEGHVVLTASDGLEGLEIIRKEKPDIALLDIMMPKLDGLQMLERLKADPETSNVPVIMLSNLGGEEEQDAALELGAVCYLVKSNHSPANIVAKINEILSGVTRGKNIPKAADM